MTTAVAKAVAQGVLNLPVDFQPPPADGANQAAGAAPAAGRPTGLGCCRSRTPRAGT